MMGDPETTTEQGLYTTQTNHLGATLKSILVSQSLYCSSKSHGLYKSVSSHRVLENLHRVVYTCRV